MNRRTFIQGVAAAGIVTLLPTWMVKRPSLTKEIDLRPFCGSSLCHFDMTTPFCQEMPSGQLFKFATDAKICVRVDGSWLDKQDDEVKRPPAFSLAWDKAKAWQPWPDKRYELAGDTSCPHCDGEGWVIDGDGHAEECSHCEFGTGVFPTYQKIGDQSIDNRYDEKIRKYLGDAEICIVHVQSKNKFVSPRQIYFRFAQGHGLLGAIDKKAAEDDMRKI